MTTSKMVNFRMKQHELDQIDNAARMSGLTRTDWIKNAIDLSLRSMTPAKPTRVKIPAATAGPQCLEVGHDVANCTMAVWTTLPTRVRLCQTCGVKVQPS